MFEECCLNTTAPTQPQIISEEAHRLETANWKLQGKGRYAWDATTPCVDVVGGCKFALQVLMMPWDAHCMHWCCGMLWDAANDAMKEGRRTDSN